MVENKEYEDETFDEEIDLKSIFFLIKRNKFLIFSITTISILVGILYSISLKRTWAGDFQIVLNKEQNKPIKGLALDVSNQIDISGLLNNANNRSGLNTQIEILKSPSVLMPIFEFVKESYRRDGNNIDELSYKKWFNQSFTIKLARRTEVLDVEYRDQNKEIILPALKKISKTYKQYSGKTKLASINSGLDYLENQIKFYKEKQLNSLKALQDFAYENDLTTDLNINDSQSQLNIESVRVIEANKIRTIDKYLEKVEEISDNPESLIYFDTIFPDFLNNQIRITAQEINNDLSNAKAAFKEGDKEILRLENELNIYAPMLKKELVSFLNSKKYEAEAKLAASKREKKIIAKYKQLISDAVMNEQTLSGLIFEERSLALQKAKTTDPWDLITEPTLKKYPVAPSRKRITLVVAIFGFLFSIFLASVHELIKGRIFREKAVQKFLNFPLIKVLDSSQIDRWPNSIDLFAKTNIFSKKSNVSFLKIGETEDVLIKKFKYLIKKSFPDFSFSYSSNLNEAMDNDEIVFIVQLGKITYNDIFLIKDDLNLQNNIRGIIYFK